MIDLAAKQPHKRFKLIFNPVSGSNRESPVQLMDIIKELQEWNFVPEPYLTEPSSDYAKIVREAMEQGMNTFVVCGGDGTVSAVARALTGTNGTLGIIPTGTQNNIAHSLGIPEDIIESISVLTTGKRIKIDNGIATCGHISMPFFEVCSVGLFSALFDPGDKIQHGDITGIRELISTLSSSPPSKIRLILNDKHEITNTGHVVMVSNMPFVGRRLEVGEPESYKDGFLDVLFCTDTSKINLMVGFIMKLQNVIFDDSRIMNFRVKKILIETQPPMPVMADGVSLGEGSVTIEIRRHTTTVLVPETKEISGELNGINEKR